MVFARHPWDDRMATELYPFFIRCFFFSYFSVYPFVLEFFWEIFFSFFRDKIKISSFLLIVFIWNAQSSFATALFPAYCAWIFLLRDWLLPFVSYPNLPGGWLVSSHSIQSLNLLFKALIPQAFCSFSVLCFFDSTLCFYKHDGKNLSCTRPVTLFGLSTLSFFLLTITFLRVSL